MIRARVAHTTIGALALAAVCAAAALAAREPVAAASGSAPSCPRRAEAPSDHHADAHHLLLTQGATSLRACRYAGLNGPGRAGHLERQAVAASKPEIVRLTRLFDQLPPSRGVRACPADDGSEILVLAAFANARPTGVQLGLTGCEMATNGVISRTALSAATGGRELVAALGALVPGIR